MSCRQLVLAGRLHRGQLRRPHQRPVPSLRRHAAAALSGAGGEPGQVPQVQRRFQEQNQQIWSFAVSQISGLLFAALTVTMIMCTLQMFSVFVAIIIVGLRYDSNHSELLCSKRIHVKLPLEHFAD